MHSGIYTLYVVFYYLTIHYCLSKHKMKIV